MSSSPLLLGIIVVMGKLPHRLVATVILRSNGCSGVTCACCYCGMYIYIASSSSRSRVHSEFVALSVRWPRKIEKNEEGGAFDFIFLGGFGSRR
jgi:uncharacterized Fe-S cluster-containing MiaB family protein